MPIDSLVADAPIVKKSLTEYTTKEIAAYALQELEQTDRLDKTALKASYQQETPIYKTPIIDQHSRPASYQTRPHEFRYAHQGLFTSKN